MNKPEVQKKPDWAMRLAVISTIATVLAVVTPFLPVWYEKNAVDEIKTELENPETKQRIKNELKELPSKLGLPPKPPFPHSIDEKSAVETKSKLDDVKRQIEKDLKDLPSKLPKPPSPPPFDSD